MKKINSHLYKNKLKISKMKRKLSRILIKIVIVALNYNSKKKDDVNSQQNSQQNCWEFATSCWEFPTTPQHITVHNCVPKYF